MDAGVWPAGSGLFRAVKRVEKRLVAEADAIVVLTRSAKELLQQWYPRETSGKQIEIIPCCVDLRGTPQVDRQARTAELTLAYVGKLGGWYMTEEMVGFVAAATRVCPPLRWRVWTQSPQVNLRAEIVRRRLGDRVAIDRVPASEIPGALRQVDAGLSFVRPSISKLASSPTKIAEYLAAGLPVVSTSGIGDTDYVLKGEFCGDGKPVGVCLPAMTEECYEDGAKSLERLLAEDDIRSRCRAVATAYYDLATIGWPRYRKVYAAIS